MAFSMSSIFGVNCNGLSQELFGLEILYGEISIQFGNNYDILGKVIEQLCGTKVIHPPSKGYIIFIKVIKNY